MRTKNFTLIRQLKSNFKNMVWFYCNRRSNIDNVLGNNHLTFEPNFLKIGRGSRVFCPNNILKKFPNRPETIPDTDIHHFRNMIRLWDFTPFFWGTGRGNLIFFIFVDSTIGVVW